jgi:DnaJ domain
MPTPTFYDILEIEQSASADDGLLFFYLHGQSTLTNHILPSVRRAYRKKALETHPDKLEPGASEAEKQDAEQQFHKVRVFYPFCRKFFA